MTIVRSILAILAGLIFVVVTSTATDAGLQHSVFPAMNTPQVTAPLLALALGYRTIYGIIAGWITARLAPKRPILHALILGAIGTLAAAAGLAAAKASALNWYPLALVILAIPQTWLGGWLATRR